MGDSLILLSLLAGWLMAKLFARLVRREKERREMDVALRFAHHQREAQIAANREKLQRGD